MMAIAPAANQDVAGPAIALRAGHRRQSLYRGQPYRRWSTCSRQAVAPAGGDQPHNNLQPYLTLNFCIALQGVFPPRT